MYFFTESTDNHPEKSKIKIAELKQEKQQMKEEIALLKLKIDLLLGMVSISCTNILVLVFVTFYKSW